MLGMEGSECEDLSRSSPDTLPIRGMSAERRPATQSMMAANLAPTSLVCVGRAGAASRAARLRMILAQSSPTSQGEHESTQESAAPACCRFEALAGYSMLAGQEPCFDGLCLNEARESEEELLPQKSVLHRTVLGPLGQMMTTL